MTGKDYTASFTVDQPPLAVFDAINNVRAWWTGKVEGDTDVPGGEFTYQYEDAHHSTQRVITFDPGRQVIWRVVDSDIAYVENRSEWTGTEMVFDIVEKTPGTTKLTFTHRGLVPSLECYAACADAWGQYIKVNLRTLIEQQGTTNPDAEVDVTQRPL